MPNSYFKGQHKGLHSYRFKDNPKEKKFAKAWEEMADRGHLEWLLGPGDKQVDISLRDVQVAATVIQWLGSPVGIGFLEKLGYIKNEKKTK